jgi:hypothetical protein
MGVVRDEYLVSRIYRTDLCCSFSYWMTLLEVARHRIRQGRAGEAL